MSLIDVPNLKEIKPWEGYFYMLQKFFKSGAKKNVKKMGQFLEVYGTHQLQLKRDTRGICVWRPRNAHELLLHASNFVCLYLLHHVNVRKHTCYLCVYTRLFTHAHASRL